MITSGDLTRKMAEALGFPEVTIGTYYRRLREEGLVPKAGRGPKSAIPMTTETAAILLTAIGGRRFETESVGDILREFQNVVSVKSVLTQAEQFVRDGVQHRQATDRECEGAWDIGPFHVAGLSELPAGHTPQMAIHAILNAYLDDSFEKAVEAFAPGQKWHFDVGVEFYGPLASAGIEVSILLDDGRFFACEVHYWSRETIDRDAAREEIQPILKSYGAHESQRYLRFFHGDLLICRSFGDQAFKIISALFHDERWNAMSEEEQEDHWIEQNRKYPRGAQNEE